MLAVSQCAACGKHLERHVATHDIMWHVFDDAAALLMREDNNFWMDAFGQVYDYCSTECEKREATSPGAVLEKDVQLLDFVQFDENEVNELDMSYVRRHPGCLMQVREDSVVYNGEVVPEFINIQCMNGNCLKAGEVLKNVFFTSCKKVHFPDMSFYENLCIPNDKGGEVVLFNSWNDADLL